MTEFHHKEDLKRKFLTTVFYFGVRAKMFQKTAMCPNCLCCKCLSYLVNAISWISTCELLVVAGLKFFSVFSVCQSIHQVWGIFTPADSRLKIYESRNHRKDYWPCVTTTKVFSRHHCDKKSLLDILTNQKLEAHSCCWSKIGWNLKHFLDGCLKFPTTLRYFDKKRCWTFIFFALVLETGKLKYLLSGRGTSAMFLIKSVS